MADESTGKRFERLVEIMSILRGPNGCPWDKEQDANTLKPMLVEEVYEVLEAIDNQDSEGISEELGDLLLHIVFQAQLGKEANRFDINTVIQNICDKLIRRHPHVFAGETAGTAAQVIKNWEAIKAQEKAEKLSSRTPEQRSLLEGIPSKLPAIHEAHQISSRVARVGFDWPDIEGIFAKLQEEVRELKEVIAEDAGDGKTERLEDEIGDMLFVIVNIARTLKIDSESALKRANRKFKSRFQYMERELTRQGKSIEDSNLAEMEALWQRAKAEKNPPMMIRPLTTLDEFQRCLELQQEAFGWADVDVLPRRFMVVLNQIGGMVLGAFDGDRLAAFLNAVPGIKDGMPYWHSHMLAVGKEYWNSGVGSDLKLAQREAALDRDIRLIEWTFDPLESKNAYLNISKLGVIVRRYYRNHYGETTGALQRGLDSDRVVAEWWLDQPRTSIQSDVRRIVIPADLQSLKSQSLDSARDIQKRVREQFLQNIAEDYFVAGFERGDEWSQYLFVPGASRVDQAD